MKEEITFITYAEAEDKEEIGIGGLGGWFNDGHRWKDFIAQWKFEEDRELCEQLRKAIIKNKIRCTGDQHQHSDLATVPVWPNGKVATFSYRGWGDLMAAIWATEDDKDYNYMDFYM